jgi:anti-sigma regulatory factor (Ser/Thr protein kinase)
VILVKKLTVEALKENLDTVIDFVNGFLEEAGCTMKFQMQVDLCVEEMFVNIASYAYGSGKGDAEIDISQTGEEISITLIDSGKPYNPLEKEDPDVSLSALDREIGGLGIFLVKKTMDSVSYEYTDGKNIFTMAKKM